MLLINKQSTNKQTRTYNRATCVVFLKTHESFGGLSNMAGGFPLHIMGTRIYTTEALYQASRFPHLPEVQRLIIGQTSPMTAKMKSKAYRNDSRPDWNQMRVKVMRWCLRVKLVQNLAKFSELLLQTGDRQIVEESRKDDFWGAKPVDERTLVGINVLGRLLMELRVVAAQSQDRELLRTVEPPDIPEFLLFGRPIEAISASDPAERGATSAASASAIDGRTTEGTAKQASLFAAPTAREAAVPAYIASQAPEHEPLGRLKPYLAMKDSGVPWLGKVPEHWELPRLGALLRERGETNNGGSVTHVLSVTRDRGVIPYADKGNIGNKKSDDITRYKIVRPDDIVVNCMNVIIGSVGLSRYTGCLSPVYYVLMRRSANDEPRYLNSFFQTKPFQLSLIRIGNGILAHRMRIPMELLKCEPFPHPPHAEQAAIVRFLEWANRRLERAIRAKRKVIALLNEQKQAIIHRAVTRGLDPTSPLKPSGIPWLGDIPQHWEARQLRHLGRLHKGVGGSKEDATPDGVPCVRYGELYFHFRNFIRAPRGFVSTAKAATYTTIRFGDVLFAASGEKVEEIGKSAVNLYQDHAVCGGDIVIFRPAVAVEAAFLGYALDSHGAAHQKSTMCRGTTIKHVYPDELRSLWMCIPPISEQKQIVATLDNDLLSCNTVISSLEHEIELLGEYRTRLVADVVTGKLDVREAAVRLPDETDEPEPLDDVDAMSDEEETSTEDMAAESEEL